MSAQQPRLGIGIISAGRVGAVLGAALRAAGHAITGVHAVSEESQSRAETLLPEVPVLSVEEICRRSELLLFAVPDDALADLITSLATQKHLQVGQLLIHTSGKFGTEVFAPATAQGCIGLAIHPIMTFTGMSLDLTRLVDCPFGVTAPATVLPIAQALVVEMGGEPITISENERTRYHLALAHGANHLNTVVGQALEQLREAGVEDPAQAMSPLLRASLENALASGENALTGPVSRGDVGTLASHLQVLAADSVPDDLRLAYTALAEATALRAVAKGRLSPQLAAPILALLKENKA